MIGIIFVGKLSEINNACLLNDKFVTTCSYAMQFEKVMFWVRITFGLQPHMSPNETIDIFLYCINN